VTPPQSPSPAAPDVADTAAPAPDPRLAVRLGPLLLRNPVMSASGTFGHGAEMVRFVSPSAMGALVLKTVTPHPRPGNALPRIHETPAGMLNSIGLENKGIDAFLRDAWPLLVDLDVPVVVNIGGESLEEYAQIAARLRGLRKLAAVEVNLSCPNVQGGRLPFATDPAAAHDAIAAVREQLAVPLFAKLSPNVARIAPIAEAVEKGGADAVTAINTLLGLGLDWRRRKAHLATIVGGFSGPAIKPVALRMVRECALAVKIPIIGCGGITSAEDVMEFLVAGATAVQVGTWSYVRPDGIQQIVGDLSRLLDEERIEALEDVIGTLDRPAPKRAAETVSR
jgi:dihydroorotate dehydrogenase (NAD+) catalytic subunit